MTKLKEYYDDLLMIESLFPTHCFSKAERLFRSYRSKKKGKKKFRIHYMRFA